MTTKGKPNRGKTVSEAEFRRMWQDPTISQGEIARRLGISGQAALYRALCRGLSPRPRQRLWTRTVDHERVARLYVSGLSIAAIAKLTGYSRGGIQNALRVKGVQPRPVGKPAPVPTSNLAVVLMAASARETEAALRLSEMVDGFRDPGRTRRAA